MSLPRSEGLAPLVFVTVGTDHHRFDRLIKWVDGWLAAGGDGRARCFVQAGTSRSPRYAEWRDYLRHEAMESFMDEAAVIVSHAGPGTIAECLYRGFTPIVVPRLKALGEGVDDHQAVFARRMARAGQIRLAASEKQFRETLDQAVADPRPQGAPLRREETNAVVKRFSRLLDELVRSSAVTSRAPRSSPSGEERSARTAGLAGSQEPWPSVSVIVPTRNRPHYLRKAVASILHQDYPGHIDCVVVFDQALPEDPPVPVPEGRRLRTLTNERSPGLAGARNTGILAADGDLIAFCDDDDDWMPDKLRLQVEALLSNPKAVAVASGIRIHTGGRTVHRVPPQRFLTHRHFLRSRVAEVHPSTLLVRRSDVRGRIGLIDEGIPGSYGEDYDWLLRATRHAPLTVVPEPLVNVNWHRGSWFAERWQLIAEAIPYILRKHPDLRQDPRGLARIYGQMAFAQAGSGRMTDARRWATRCLRLNWKEPRGYIALAVSVRLARADTLVRLANRFGRGI